MPLWSSDAIWHQASRPTVQVMACRLLCTKQIPTFGEIHDDVIKWKHSPRYWPFVRGIHRSPVNSPHKGQWRGALMFSLICIRINGWVNNREAGDLRRHRAHYNIVVMDLLLTVSQYFWLKTMNFELPSTKLQQFFSDFNILTILIGCPHNREADLLAVPVRIR